eukprot:g28018.t1
MEEKSASPEQEKTNTDDDLLATISQIQTLPNRRSDRPVLSKLQAVVTMDKKAAEAEKVLKDLQARVEMIEK